MENDVRKMEDNILRYSLDYSLFFQNPKKYSNGSTGCIKRDESGELVEKEVFLMNLPFLRELFLYYRSCHPNIGKIYAYQSKPVNSLLMKFYKNGTLTSKYNTMGDTESAIIAYGIALGMSYIHDVLNTIHRDLKPENIIIDGMYPIIIDFGESFCLNGLYPAKHSLGTPLYSSPEAFNSNIKLPMKESDVFSYGLLLYSMIEKSFPTYEPNPGSIDDIRTILNKKIRPKQTKNVDLNPFWAWEPKDRLTFSQIVQRFPSMIKNLFPETDMSTFIIHKNIMDSKARESMKEKALLNPIPDLETVVSNVKKGSIADLVTLGKIYEKNELSKIANRCNRIAKSCQ